MGNSKYYLLGQLNQGASNYKDFTTQASAPSRPFTGRLRAWIDSLGVLNFLPNSGPGVKVITGTQADYDDAVLKKHANTDDHTHTNQSDLDTVSGTNTGDQDLSVYSQGVQGALSGTSHDGNARGADASDFQFVRDAVAKVASGIRSFIGGGQNNTASGTDSFIGGGKGNIVSGLESMASGEYNEVSGEKSAALCSGNIISGNQSFACGEGNNISSYGSFAEGNGNTITADCCHAEGSLNDCTEPYSHAEGLCAKTYNKFQHAKASWDFLCGDTKGEAQYTNIIARLETADDTPYELLVGEDGVISLMDNKMNAFRVLVVASDESISEGAAYEFKGLIKKGATAASTAIIGSVSKTVIAESDAAWDADITADTTNGALCITVTGDDTNLTRFVAFVEMVEVAFYG